MWSPWTIGCPAFTRLQSRCWLKPRLSEARLPDAPPTAHFTAADWTTRSVPHLDLYVNGLRRTHSVAVGTATDPGESKVEPQCPGGPKSEVMPIIPTLACFIEVSPLQHETELHPGGPCRQGQLRHPSRSFTHRTSAPGLGVPPVLPGSWPASKCLSVGPKRHL